jgi:hypothetical protein
VAVQRSARARTVSSRTLPEHSPAGAREVPSARVLVRDYILELLAKDGIK